MSDWSRWHPQHLPNCQACLHTNSRCLKSLSSCADLYPERWVRSAPGLCFGPKSKPDTTPKTYHPILCAGLLDQAHEQLKEAVYLYGRVCDDLEPEACYCHSLLAKVAFLQGKPAEVLLQHFIAAWTHLSTVPGPWLWFSYQTAYSKSAFHMQISLDLVIYNLDIIWGYMTFILIIQFISLNVHIWPLSYDP